MARNGQAFRHTLYKAHFRLVSFCPKISVVGVPEQRRFSLVLLRIRETCYFFIFCGKKEAPNGTFETTYTVQGITLRKNDMCSGIKWRWSVGVCQEIGDMGVLSKVMLHGREPLWRKLFQAFVEPYQKRLSHCAMQWKPTPRHWEMTSTNWNVFRALRHS